MKILIVQVGGSDSIIYELVYVVPAHTLQVIEIGAFGDGTVVKMFHNISIDMFSDLLDSINESTYLQFIEWLQKDNKE